MRSPTKNSFPLCSQMAVTLIGYFVGREIEIRMKESTFISLSFSTPCAVLRLSVHFAFFYAKIIISFSISFTLVTDCPLVFYLNSHTHLVSSTCHQVACKLTDNPNALSAGASGLKPFVTQTVCH